MSARRFNPKNGDVFAARYRIEGIVGRGGFGAVYRASDLVDGGSVVLKVMLSTFSANDTDLRRFKREAALVKELVHPNIVRVTDFGQDEKARAFIAFELLEGCSLAEALERAGPLELGHVMRIGIDSLHALIAAHECGIIHRDIKPQNVFLLDAHPWTKVLDFGVAKALNREGRATTELTEAGQAVGTPQYMAPEQVRGEQVHPSTDLYALGLVLTEALTGERVVVGDSLISVYLTHVSPDRLPLDPRVLASPLGPILYRATSKPLAERYTSAREMLADLESLSVDSSWRVPSPFKTRPLAAIALGGSATILMEDADEDLPSSRSASTGARAFGAISVAPANVASTRSRSSSQRDLLVAEAAAQPAPAGVWLHTPASTPSEGSPRITTAPMSVSRPAHAFADVPQPPALAPAFAPQSHGRLRGAVVLVFALVAVAIGVGLWLHLSGVL